MASYFSIDMFYVRTINITLPGKENKRVIYVLVKVHQTQHIFATVDLASQTVNINGCYQCLDKESLV